MKAFYPGQRVRVIGPYYHDHVGRETVVLRLGMPGCYGRAGLFVDGVEVDIPLPRGPWPKSVYKPQDLEPIDTERDGNQAGEWDAVPYFNPTKTKETIDGQR